MNVAQSHTFVDLFCVLCAQGVLEYNVVFRVHVASFHRYLDTIGDDI